MSKRETKHGGECVVIGWWPGVVVAEWWWWWRSGGGEPFRFSARIYGKKPLRFKNLEKDKDPPWGMVIIFGVLLELVFSELNYANVCGLLEHGATVSLGVNCVHMASDPKFEGQLYDRLIYNLPHAGFLLPEDHDTMILGADSGM